MNKVKFSLFALVAIIAASCVADPVMEGEGVVAEKNPMAKIINSSEDAVAGELILYVDEQTADAWSINTTRSGNSMLDAVAEELGVESVKPVFNMAVNADLKRAQGMHRWYVVKFDNEANLDVVAEKFAAISSIDRVQFSTVVDKPQISATPVSVSDVNVTRVGETEYFDDPMLYLQWHYNNRGYQSFFPGAKEGEDIGAYGAWDYTTGNSEVIVAVVDEGVKYDHPDLAANMWVNQAEKNGQEGVDDDGNGYVDDIYGINAARAGKGPITWDQPAWNSKNEYVGDSGHGTHVAGTIAAVNNNGIGVCGVAGGNGSGNGVRIMSIQIFDGSVPAEQNGIDKNAMGIEYAADNGASILQNSWGYDGEITSDGFYSGHYGVEIAALKYFQSKSNCAAMTGNVVIFAAGNSANDFANYPGAYNEFICVTALAPDGMPTTYTCYEEGCNVAAPGGESEVLEGDNDFTDYGCVLSTLPAETPDPEKSRSGVVPYGKDYGYMMGTSMACPHVSGVAALVLSYALDHGIKLSNTQLYDVITSSVRNIDDSLTGSVPRHYWTYSQTTGYQLHVKNFDLSAYKGKMGTGKLDATLAIMNVRGATCIPVVVNEEFELNFGKIIGTGDINVTVLKDFVITDEVKNRLGIDTYDYFNNKIYLKCTKPGIGVITVKYIAGGKTVGGTSATGGKLMEKEVVIISRENNDNGAWL